LSKNNK